MNSLFEGVRRTIKRIDAQKETMAGFYNCPYILRTGEVCNKGCYHPAGCKVHRNSPKQVLCIHPGCVKLTFSIYNACRKHSGKYRSREFYQQRKLAKIQASDEEDLGIDLFGNNP